MDWKQLFQQHIDLRQKQANEIIAQHRLQGLVLCSGAPLMYYEDDQAAPFRSSPHFAHWIPARGENHFLVVQPSKKPKLYYFQPADFWHDHVSLENDYWLDSVDLKIMTESDQFWKEFREDGPFAFSGPGFEKAAEEHGFVRHEAFLNYLNWYRGFKSDYELGLLDEATKIAAYGHKAAAEAFLEGCSEWEIHHRYLYAAGATESELPYRAIVALNEKAATLHYGAKRRQVNDPKVLLIDAGASHQGYGSDITRTYTKDSAHPVFRELVSQLDAAQKKLCTHMAVGMRFEKLHRLAHKSIAEILSRVEILKKNVSIDEAIENDLTRPFFPHGLGHLLGVQVHDVGGRQQNSQGGQFLAEPPFSNLRLTREMSPRMVVTIEPGIYFIPMLLRPLADGPCRDKYNWALIEKLYPCGGIRIEDNVYLSESGETINLTRKYLA